MRPPSAATRFTVSVCAALVAALALGSLGRLEAQTTIPRLDISAIGVLAEYGTDERNDLAVLQKPLDAVFTNGQVAILDASSPWIRIFDVTGTFVRAMARRGEGPAEALRPMSLSAASNGDLLLSHSLGLTRFSNAGNVVMTARQELRAHGAIQACGDLLFAQIESTGVIPPHTQIVRLSSSGTIESEMITIRNIRPDSRASHAWYAVGDEAGILLYPEEENSNRLIQVDCEGNIVHAFELDSLGTGVRREYALEGSQSSLRVRTPSPPYPAGLARIGESVVWASQIVDRTSAEAPDSLTLITVIDGNNERRRLYLNGWYQLFDGDSAGRLLFGNAWTLGVNWTLAGTTGLIPKVILVDGSALVAAAVASGNGSP